MQLNLIIRDLRMCAVQILNKVNWKERRDLAKTTKQFPLVIVWLAREYMVFLCYGAVFRFRAQVTNIFSYLSGYFIRGNWRKFKADK